jgi:beta-lactamase regulating signal transducer with metallopeptidase domain/prefoldin subunit 5
MSAMMLVSTLGWALIHFLWQGLLVGLAAALALMLLRNARPQARYAVSCAALALCLALPVAGVWRGLGADASFGTWPVANAVHFIATTSGGAVLPLTSWQSKLQENLAWIVALWSIGAGLLALRMALGMAWVGRIGRSPSGGTDQRWQARLDRLASAFAMYHDICLRVVADLHSPVAAGWWRPMVLVPAALLANMPPDLLEALLAHELAHIKRQDYLVNLMQSAIEALLFYHPVVWWLSRQIRVEREQIADDLAAAALGEPRRLARALHELDQFQLGNATFSNPHLTPLANGGNLMSRIQRLIRPNRHALSWKMALPIIGLTALCLTVYAQDSAPVATVATRPVPATPSVAPIPPVESTAAIEVIAPVVATAGTSNGRQPGGRTIRTSDRREDAYAVVRAGHAGITMSGDTRDIPAIEKTRQKVHGDFVWVRRGEKTYVVQDPAVIANVVAAMQPAEALDAQMEVLSAQMEGPNQQMEALDKQMDALSDKGRPEDAAMEKASAEMEELGRQQEAIGAKMEALGQQMEQAKEPDREAMDRQMEALQTQMEPLNHEMEKLSAVMEEHGKDMEAAQKPMEELSRQMEEASKPMEALGKQMEVLGKQIEELSLQAEQTVKALLDGALKSGKAVPADRMAGE